MAGRIAGITIEIGGDTSNLQKSLKGVDSELRKTQSTLKDVNKLLKLDPGNTELLTQKQKNLEKAISTTKTRLDELNKAQEGVKEGSAEWDALQREIIATEQDLQGLEQEYRNFGSVGAQQVAAVGAKMQEVGGKIEGIGQKLAPVSAAAAGVVASLVGLGYSAITSADDLNTLSKQTGLSTAEIQKMQYAADLVDVSFEDISGALKKMKGKMDPANETFQKLGVSVTDANGELRDSSTVFYEAIEALSGIENETERDQVAMDLFGKSADQLAGIIDDGGAALKAFGQDAEDMGLILDQETLDSLNAINDTVDKTKARFRGAFAKAGATLAQKFAPALDKAAAFAEKLADKIANLSPETLGLITKIAGVVAAIAPVLIVGGKLTSGIGKVLSYAPQIKAAITAVTAALSSPVAVIALVVAAVAALGVVIYKNWDKIKAWTLGLVENIKAGWDNLKTAVAEKWEAIKGAIVTKVESIKTSVIEKWENLKSDASQKWEEVKTSIEGVIDGAKESIVAKWEEVKTSVTQSVQNIKNNLTTKWSLIKTTVSTTVTNITDKVTSKWDEAKTNVSTAVTNIKTEVETKWNAIKTSVSTIGQNIANTVRTKFNLAKANALSIFSGIKSGIEEKINNAKATVSSVIEDIKGFFDFEWKLPHLKLPHIILHKGVYPWGIFGQGEAPTVDIEWYRKAYDTPVMFTQPTVLQTPQGLKGFGDSHGAEIVLGLNKLRELVGTSGNQVTINVYPPPGANVEQIAAAVEQKLVAAQQRRIRVYA